MTSDTIKCYLIIRHGTDQLNQSTTDMFYCSLLIPIAHALHSPKITLTQQWSTQEQHVDRAQITQTFLHQLNRALVTCNSIVSTSVALKLLCT